MIDSREMPASQVLCPACNSREVRSQFVDTSFLYGEGETAIELAVTLQAFECLSCGLEYLDDGAEDLKHEAVCRHLRVFTPAEIQSIRNALGMTRSQFAQLTRIGEATLGRWERGALIQNASHDQFMYLLTFRDNVLRLLNREQPRSSVNTQTTATSDGIQSKFKALSAKGLDAAVKRAALFNLHVSEAA